MEFHKMFPAKLIFIGIVAFFCLGADSESINSKNSPKTTPTSQKIIEFISPAIFSEADPFKYLIRESSKLRPVELNELNKNLQSGLKTNQFAETYIPYVRALQSIIRGLQGIQYIIYTIKEFRNSSYLSSISVEIPPPPEVSAVGLYSDDIFSDPKPAVPLFDKLLRIPKKEIPNLIIKLEKFGSVPKISEMPLVRRSYLEYAGKLAYFLRKNYYIVVDMKREMVAINRLSGDKSAVDISDETDTESDDSLGIIGASDNLSDLLSSAVFSNPDPFQYLLRESSKLQTSAEIEQLTEELQFRLKTDQFSNRYAPYARALYSIMNCRKNLRNVRFLITRIRTDPDCNEPTITSSPSEITSSGVFSSDIFSDSDPVTRLVNTFLKMSTKGISQLRKFLSHDLKILKERKDAPFAWTKYIRYAESLLLFLQKDSVLSKLRLEMVEMQRIMTTSRQNFNDNLSGKEPESSDAHVDHSLKM